MEDLTDLYSQGLFEPKHRTFLETLANLRPVLHRYCSRMMGNVMEGEEAVQEALFLAYRKLDQYDESRPLKPWLFQIAHNRCLDLIRRRKVTAEAEAGTEAMPETDQPMVPVNAELAHAVEHLVIHLPPKERACVLLKDVFDYSLLEIAELVASTEGGVKAALNRGRTKLASLPASQIKPTPNPELAELLKLYVEGFNRKDWAGLQNLISADARLLFANGYAGPLKDSGYFTKYEGAPMQWKMVAGEADGDPVVIIMVHDAATGWAAKSLAHLEIEDGRIVRIKDYLWCPWVLSLAQSVSY